MLQMTVKTGQNRVQLWPPIPLGIGDWSAAVPTSFGRVRRLVKQTLAGSMRVVVSQPR